MAVPITPQALILALDTNWAEKAQENGRRANANDAALQAAVEELQNAAPVRKVKVGTTTYTPDGAGLVELPAGIVLPPMTTAQRDAVTSPTVGQAILNTTTGSPQIYTATGWQDFRPNAFRTVFTASATWTKPLLTRFVRVIVFGAGGGAGAIKREGITYRKQACGGCGGGRAEEWFQASDVPASVAVSVGAGGAGGAFMGSTAGAADGLPGSGSAFGSLLRASGGGGGIAGDEPTTRWQNMGAGLARATTPMTNAYFFVGSSSGYLDGLVALLGNEGAGGQSMALDANGGRAIGPGGADGAGAGGSAYTGGNGTYTPTGSGVGGGSGPFDSIDTTRHVPTAPTAPTVGITPTSKSGTGRAGDGGGCAVVNSTAPTTYSVTGGAGGIPGAGGGAAALLETGALTTLTGGAGARGEVIVDVFF